MAASPGVTVPIVCRFVSTDQWMETHLNSSWKIAEVKLWILAKFLPSVFTSVPFLPRALSSQKRAVSPIRFASRQQIRVNKHSHSTDAYYLEDDYDEDEDDLEDGVHDRYKYGSPVNRPSTSSNVDSAKLGVVGDPFSSTSCDPTTYTLLSFTTGQILEDHCTLSWYNIQSHELLELHVSPFVVTLPRAFPDEYVQPYFEARVWALRAVHRHFDSRMEPTSRWADLDGKHSDGEDSRREKLKKRKTKLEWRERWIVVHQGVLTLCRHRNDPKPSITARLSSLLAIRGSDHLHSTGASAFVTDFVPPNTSGTPPSQYGSPQFNYVPSAHGQYQSHLQPPRDNSRTIVCVKFKAETKHPHRKSNVVIDPPLPYIPLSRATTATGTSWGAAQGSSRWWKQSQKDHRHSTPGSANNSAHSSAHSSSNEAKQPGLESFNTLVDDHRSAHYYHHYHFQPHRRRPYSEHWEDDVESQGGHLWIALDLLDQPAFQNFIRLLHRHAPPSTPTSFISEPKSTPSPPPSRLPSRSASPITFASPTSSTPTSRPSSRAPSSIGSGTTIRGDETFSPGGPHSQFELPGIPEGPGASYPDWRLNVTKRARKAGLGDVGRAMEWAMFGGIETANEREKDRRGRSPVRHGLGNSSTTAMPELQFQGIISDDTDSDDSDGDGPQSELEWEGWMEDVKQKWKFARENVHDLVQPPVCDDKNYRRRRAVLADVHWDPQFDFGIPLSRTVSPPNAESLLSPEPHSRHPRSLNSYASADSLLKKAVKRLESKRSPPGPRSRPRSPSTELDEEDEADEYDRVGYGIEIAVDDDEEQHSSSAASSLTTPHMTYPNHPHLYNDDDHRRHAHSHDGHSPRSSHGSHRGAPISMAMTTITSTVSVGSPPGQVESPATSKMPRRRSNTSMGLSPASATSFGKFAVRMKRSRDSLQSANSHTNSSGKHPEEAQNPRDQHKHERHRRGPGLFNIQPGKLKLSLPFSQHGSSHHNRNRNSHPYPHGDRPHPEQGQNYPPSAYRNPDLIGIAPQATLSPISPSTGLSPNTASPLSPFESPTFAHPEDSD